MSTQPTSAVPSTNEALPLPAATDFDARRAYGKEARRRTPRSSHTGWTPPAGRADPVSLLEEQATTRVPELVPIRHARMMVSPFTFYRGAALLMAADLAGTPVSGITTQICGDAHLSNFGVFGTPERRLVFDMNDFDETLPGPWEWDVKRLAASFEVAGRSRGFTDEERHEINLLVVRGYRERMLQAADSGVLDAWYDQLDTERFVAYLEEERKQKQLGAKQVKRTDAALAKARTTARSRSRRCPASNPRCRPATSTLATSRFTSHSHGPGRVSSKSFMSKINVRSGVPKTPKFDRCASPQTWVTIPDTGVRARSVAMSSAAPR